MSMLKGKSVLLLFATFSCYECGQFLPKLKKMYDKYKGTDDQFEVIYMSLGCALSPSSFDQSIRNMPWLIHAYEPQFATAVAERLFGMPPLLPAIAAFEADGHLDTKESNLAFKKHWDSKYPFIQAEMDDEICRELKYQHHWDLNMQYLSFPNISN